MTTTAGYDPQAIAKACLDHQLNNLTDMDHVDIDDIAGYLGIPDDEDDDGWSTVAAALSQLADQVRDHLGIPRACPTCHAGEVFNPDRGDEVGPPQPGYRAGRCGHRVALTEWRAGFRVCERCEPIDCPDCLHPKPTKEEEGTTPQ